MDGVEMTFIGVEVDVNHNMGVAVKFVETIPIVKLI